VDTRNKEKRDEKGIRKGNDVRNGKNKRRRMKERSEKEAYAMILYQLLKLLRVR
jgi:hypothetical protein